VILSGKLAATAFLLVFVAIFLMPFPPGPGGRVRTATALSLVSCSVLCMLAAIWVSP